VLVLHSELGVLRGGGENFTRNLFAAFARRGHHVAAAFVANRRGSYSIPLPEGVEPIPIPGWWSRTLGQAALSSIGRRVSSDARVKRHWNRLQDGLGWRTARWHGERFRSRVTQRFAGPRNGFDAVYVHSDVMLAGDMASHYPTILRLPGPVDEHLAPTLRAVHAVCANGDVLKRIRGFLGERAIELPIGLNDQVFAPGPSCIRAELGWTAEHRVVGYVGRLTPLKGVDLLAASFRELSCRMPEARLLVIGKGEEEKTLRAVLEDQIASGVVHIEADVEHDKLPAWYRAMDLMVMPSRYENYSNAAIEAMACGVPVLASDIGGNRIIADDDGAWLFKSESIPALNDRLAAVLTDGPELKARGCRAARSMRGRYSWDATARRLEEIFTCHTPVGR
jgi:glycosyltransferase involved in cell wall biosynthesis